MNNVIKLIVIDQAAERANASTLSDPRVRWSSTTEIIPVAIDDCYQIFYHNDDFWSIDTVKLIELIRKTFNRLHPGVKFKIECHPFTSESRRSEKILGQIASAFAELNGESTDDEDDDDDLGSSPTWGVWDGLGGSFVNGMLEDDDEDEDDEIEDDNDGRIRCQPSRVIKHAKHPKRDIKRHNIIVASKKDVERDKATIKAFLKEFMPGKEKWIKEYRAEIAGRWIRSLAVKEKEAKRRQKEFRSREKKAKAKRYVRTIGDVTNQVLRNRSRNAFYDPNK